MKYKIILILALLTFSLPSLANDWDDFSAVDRAWDGQKTITNQEFEKAIDSLEGNKKQNEAVQKKKKAKKISGGGTSLHSELAPDGDINLFNPLKKNEDGVLLNIPVNLIVDEVPLEKGFYKIIAEKDKNNDIYLSFYQSQFFKGKVRASETKDDYAKETIDFVELLPHNNHFVKIIFGSLDFNAYAYIRFLQE